MSKRHAVYSRGEPYCPPLPSRLLNGIVSPSACSSGALSIMPSSLEIDKSEEMVPAPLHEPQHDAEHEYVSLEQEKHTQVPALRVSAPKRVRLTCKTPAYQTPYPACGTAGHASSAFLDVRVTTADNFADPRAEWDKAIAALAVHIRERVTLPLGCKRPSDCTDMQLWKSVQQLPVAHCAFVDCSWVGASEVDLKAHLVDHEVQLQDAVTSAHRQVFVPTGSTASDLRMWVYTAALSLRSQRQAPIACPSIDRRALAQWSSSMVDNNLQTLVCCICAQKYACVSEESAPYVKYYKAMTRGPEDGTLRFFGGWTTSIRQIYWDSAATCVATSVSSATSPLLGATSLSCRIGLAVWSSTGVANKFYVAPKTSDAMCVFRPMHAPCVNIVRSQSVDPVTRLFGLSESQQKVLLMTCGQATHPNSCMQIRPPSSR